MAAEDAETFLERYRSDAEFRRQMDDAVTPDEKQIVLRRAGLDLTAGDLGALRERRGGPRELSAADLELIAGGRFEPGSSDYYGGRA